MRGQNKGHTVQLLGQEAGHRCIPGMSVDNIDFCQFLYLREVQAEGLERRLELRLRAFCDLTPGLLATDMQVASIEILLAPAVHFDGDLLSQFTA